MKTTDQELQKIAKSLAIKIEREAIEVTYSEDDVNSFYSPTRANPIILEALTQVRDAQEKRINWITNEIKCRIDHGAESNGHLEGLLKLIEGRK